MRAVLLLSLLFVALSFTAATLRLDGPGFAKHVASAIPEFKQEYGYINVNPSENANLFYWLFESANNPQTAPLVLWLTGGPGCSSELAIFFENGPFKVNPSTLQLVPNPWGWNQNVNLLYVDQPAGTGFSYANNYYIGNETQVAQEMYTFIQGFLNKFPQYKSVDFYITGESYAGHYIPATGAYILQQNQNSNNAKINLKAVAIGDGLIDSVATAGSWGPFLYYHNLISSYDLSQIQNQYYGSCLPDVQQGNYQSAFSTCNQVIQMCLQAAGNINPYDIRKQCTYEPLCYDTSYITTYLNQASVRQQLGVGNIQWQACNMAVYAPFESKDFYFSYRFDIPKILAGARVLIYNGDQDLIVDFYGTSAMLDSMKWSGQSGFAKAANTTWTVSGKVAGSARTYGNLTYVVVANAGHMVPHDQPQNALDLLTRFVNNQHFA